MRQYCTTHRIYWPNVSYYKYISYYKYVYEAILYYAQDILAKRELLQIRLRGHIVLRTGYWPNVSYYKYVYEAILYNAQDILAKRELLQNFLIHLHNLYILVLPLQFQRLVIFCFQVAIWLEFCSSNVNPQNNNKIHQQGYIVLRTGYTGQMWVTITPANMFVVVYRNRPLCMSIHFFS